MATDDIGNDDEAMKQRLRAILNPQCSERKASSFYAFVAGIRIGELRKTEAQKLPKIQDADCTYLTFASWDNPLVTTLVRESKSPLISWRDEWVSFETFYESIVSESPFPLPTGDNGHDFLWRWYKFRETPFRFLELPKELRLEIYEYVAGEEIYPQIRSFPPGVLPGFGNGWIPKAPRNILEGTHNPANEVRPPLADILGLNKQIRDEALEPVWSHSRQSFEHPNALLQVAMMRPLLPAKALTRIALNFDNSTYIKFFGMQVFPWRSPDPGVSWILHPDFLPCLQELRILFRYTRWEPLTNPWSTFEQLARMPQWQGQSACQKVVSEMILTYALDSARHIPKVLIEGYVKTSTKLRFRDALAELKEDRSKQEADAWTMKKEEITNMDPANLPPQCHCAKPCAFWGVGKILGPGRPSGRQRRPRGVKQYFSTYEWDDDD